MRLMMGWMLALSVIPITPGQAAEIKRLEEELMAPCCYTQTIREHMSEVAEQMREEVTEFVLEGQPEREILRYYKTRYGEAILAVPDGLTGQVVFAVPVAAFGFAMATLGWMLYRLKRRSVAEGEPSPVEFNAAEWQAIRRRIAEELGD